MCKVSRTSSFSEKANQCFVPETGAEILSWKMSWISEVPVRYHMASAEAVICVEVNAVVMRRLTLPPQAKSWKCLFALIVDLGCGLS